jgi:hypothetical protein
MRTAIEYRGHMIEATSEPYDDPDPHSHLWSCAYQIDGGPLRRQFTAPLRNELIMLEEGMDEARREVDALKAALRYAPRGDLH